MLEFLVDNIFVFFTGKVFQQIIGIPIGTNCVPLLAKCLILRAVWRSNKHIGQGYVKDLRKSYGRYGGLPNNSRSSSPECYTTFWMMTNYSDTLHWSGITPIFDPITDLDLITEFDFLPNCATGAACQQRTLTPPDTWSFPTSGLASVLILTPISPELV